jgi:hypothetical protein
VARYVRVPRVSSVSIGAASGETLTATRSPAAQSPARGPVLARMMPRTSVTERAGTSIKSASLVNSRSMVLRSCSGDPAARSA